MLTVYEQANLRIVLSGGNAEAIYRSWNQLLPIVSDEASILKLVSERCPVMQIREEARKMLVQESVSPELSVAV
jgi:hypothetical protein